MEVPDFALATSTGTCWPFSNLYKHSGSLELSQKQKRAAFLEHQKERRHQAADKNRMLCEEFIKLVEDDKMECQTSQGTKRSKAWRSKLMQSEWLTEVPDDLHDNWVVKFAPKGFRILLVAHNQRTIGYNDSGKIIFTTVTKFPGGGKFVGHGITVLDCIYNKSLRTIFILDGLFWNSMSLVDCDACFRFFWLKNKFAEEPELGVAGWYRFVLLETMPAQKPLIQDRMFSPFLVGKDELYFDGVVFYHKESHYVFEPTPLVGWLASYMLPEKLNIDVPVDYMNRKPAGYVCQQSYLEQLKMKKEKKTVRKEPDVEMELQ